MKYRIAYIIKSGEFKSKNFETRAQLDNFIFTILTEIKRGRCINKETKEVKSYEECRILENDGWLLSKRGIIFLILSLTF